MDEPGKPTDSDLAALLAAITAMEPHFRGVPPKRIQALAAKLALDDPSPEDIQEALAWVKAHRDGA